jgi:2-haloacid dehalogenase
MSRLRSFGLCAAGLLILLTSASSAPRAQAPHPRFKAVAFDYFVVFNPDSVIPVAEHEFPGKGRDLVIAWRTRQFEYSWLRSIAGPYVDFYKITEESLTYAANALSLDLTAERKARLLDGFLQLAPWPDAADALQKLKNAGVRVITIANFSPMMLRMNAANAGLTPLFDEFVSTDETHTYKPDPRAYRLGMDHLKLAKDQVLFAAFGGWDAAGAKKFGYPTYWVNRFNQPVEELGVHADRTSTDLAGLLDFVLGSSAAK